MTDASMFWPIVGMVFAVALLGSGIYYAHFSEAAKAPPSLDERKYGVTFWVPIVVLSIGLAYVQKPEVFKTAVASLLW